MFADYVKMAAKGIALVGAVALILGFLASFSLPAIDISYVGAYMNKAYTIGVHYIPYFAVLWQLGVTLITLNVTLYGVKLGLIAFRWVFKINE